MTGYHAPEATLGTRFYFTAPYSAWQRGSIKHLNGLIHRTYPKGTDLTPGTQEDCTRLDYQTPEERYG